MEHARRRRGMAARISIPAAALAATLALAGCNGADRGVYVGSAVEGNWMSADGATITRFSGGNFQTTFAGTGEMLADGTYQMTDGRTVRIAMRSLVRQTQSTVTCSVASSVMLNCSNSEGQQFTLTRRVG